MKIIHKLSQLTYLQAKNFFKSQKKWCSFKKEENSTKNSIDLAQFTPQFIRNFCIIAHIDHGKSTLSDRFLEIAGHLQKEDKAKQYLDKLLVEKKKGITIKAQSCSLVVNHKNNQYLLNLVDTPGHVDFSFEVHRSLPACQGAILLIDACSGVQAQTVAHFNQAFLSDVTIIPVINKIDMKNANSQVVCEQLNNLFSFDKSDILLTSAKTGQCVANVIEKVIEKIPPPKADNNKPFQALLFDSWFDQYRGVIIMVAVLDGQVKIGDKISFFSTKQSYKVKTLGIMYPEEIPINVLYAGQIGLISANIRDSHEAKIGEILIDTNEFNKMDAGNNDLKSKIKNIPIIKKAKSMVYAGIFPNNSNETLSLRQALEKLMLNDASVTITPDHSPALGQGWRLGFLGLLHMEVFTQRLEDEFDSSVVITSPSVPYRITVKGAKNIKKYNGSQIIISNPNKLPDVSVIEKYEEPMVIGTIIAPDEYMSSINRLCMERRGTALSSTFIDQKRMIMRFKLPMAEVIINFFDHLQRLTSGFASFDYEEADFEETNIVKVEFLLNSKPVEELTTLIVKSRARNFAKEKCIRIRETLPPQQFKIIIQGAIGGRIIAREDISALKKNVTQKLYGGDVSRRMKLLERQREGKQRLRMIGNIPLTRETFIQILKQ